ncbi:MULTISPECIES: aromatic ring-hydroxylating dioxygenase subunit alpha [Cytobacillus]|uniref:aromatic ring-hydroxylating oxygenase subunit alpha n=1 Tax=Cytobacillus TaxID=2675230 RepID=UPI0018655488|nr:MULTISPECIES: aromatic ring-hydroxylating dioxygenase subunit alpha [Cytobacillus]MCM3403561.1 aromatic ring-hydroxylating dioxygenase subunit alpha [Cytobacillus oceanisediminis]MDK7667215.1 aromatic ring-hydroxylating dioxygenase subunit alpha [Cytobacillus oceanisediminis]QOK26709.1 aromatic ring-hydroxylating dioxygenase subunit alpha [Cytobacillus oceanisediminis]
MTAYNKVQNATNRTFERTLTYDKYTDPKVLEKEMDLVFSRSWQLVGHVSQVEKAGDFFTAEVAGEPIIVNRGKDEVVRAFYNVCPHRATKLEKNAAGNKKILQCAYHGWTFKLDGQLNKAPNFRGEDEACVKDACLRSVRMEILESLIFVNLDDNAKPLSESYGDFFERLSKNSFLSELKRTGQKTRTFKANWKAFMDNYLECDHCHVAHPSFVAALDMNDYQIITCENYSMQGTIVKPDKKYGTVDLNDAEMQGGQFYWLWPNLMLTIYPGPGNMATIQIIPIDHETSMAVYTYYFRDENLSQAEKDLMTFAEQVRSEDIELVELEQIGFRSRAFSKGRYSSSEKAIVQFHEMVLEALNE